MLPRKSAVHAAPRLVRRRVRLARGEDAPLVARVALHPVDDIFVAEIVVVVVFALVLADGFVLVLLLVLVIVVVVVLLVLPELQIGRASCRERV